jgi:phosphoglycerate dehydrogenase-like enzyme
MESEKLVNANFHSLGKLGWIGLGHMGSRIATRLRNAGLPLMVYDRDRSKADELVSQGAKLATSLAELAPTPTLFFPVCPTQGQFGASTLKRTAYCRTQNLEPISSR